MLFTIWYIFEGVKTVDYRKIIKFGTDGLVLTIPKGWIRYYGLEAGDKLEVIADGDLIVRPTRKRRHLKK